MTAAGPPVRRLGAVALCTAVLWISTLWTPGAAQASPCTGGSGVTVVVDFGPYGGIQTGCAPDPTNGLSALSQAGFSTAMVTGQPGFVCRINGTPPVEDDPCVRTPPATAYWAYWQAPPGASAWTYGSQGAANTRPVDGATEGWAFGETARPGIPPPVNRVPPPPPPPRPTSSTPPRPPPPPTSSPSRPSAPPPPPVTTGPSTAQPAGSSVPPTATSSAAPATTPPGSTSPSTTASSTTTAEPTETRADPPATATDDAGPPWDAVAVGLVAAALSAGAYWQIRTRP